MGWEQLPSLAFHSPPLAIRYDDTSRFDSLTAEEAAVVESLLNVILHCRDLGGSIHSPVPQDENPTLRAGVYNVIIRIKEDGVVVSL